MADPLAGIVAAGIDAQGHGYVIADDDILGKLGWECGEGGGLDPMMGVPYNVAQARYSVRDL